MRLAAFVVVAAAIATPAMAQSQNLICVGRGACSQAITQVCSVALGDAVELPLGRRGNHVLATPAGVSRLYSIDEALRRRINAEAGRFGRLEILSPADVDRWNEACGGSVS